MLLGLLGLYIYNGHACSVEQADDQLPGVMDYLSCHHRYAEADSKDPL